jgi:hypothetical protein
MNQLLAEIDAFCAAHNMSDTRFSTSATKDKHFVKLLREGRDIRLSTLERVRHFMLTYREDAA